MREWKDNNLLNEKLRNSDYIKIIEENLMNVQQEHHKLSHSSKSKDIDDLEDVQYRLNQLLNSLKHFEGGVRT